jgi:hypothetical protein
VSNEGSTGGYLIYGYLDHQTSKKQVEEKRESEAGERQQRYREKLKEESNAVTNELITEPEYRIQNTEVRIQNTDITTKELPMVRVKSIGSYLLKPYFSKT